MGAGVILQQAISPSPDQSLFATYPQSSAPTVLVLPHGRRLCYQEFGHATGFPLFYFHDSGSSRLECAFFHRSARLNNYRLVAVDRPGIGGSEYCSMYSPQEFCTDVLTLADHLGIARFGVMSLGAGGIFGLTMAHRHPQRVAFQLNLAGVPGSVFNEVGSSSYAASCWNELTPPIVKLLVRLRHILLPSTTAQYIARLQKYLSSIDRKVLRDPAVMAILEQDQQEALRHGYKGVAQDLAICFRKLDFNLQEVAVPIVIWQGCADRLSQRSDCEYMVARMPVAKFHRVRNRGHFFFVHSMDYVFGQLGQFGQANTKKSAIAA
jgi:pimeloyl-ACP methyl ester carboxylesterase